MRLTQQQREKLLSSGLIISILLLSLEKLAAMSANADEFSFDYAIRSLGIACLSCFVLFSSFLAHK